MIHSNIDLTSIKKVLICKDIDSESYIHGHIRYAQKNIFILNDSNNAFNITYFRSIILEYMYYVVSRDTNNIMRTLLFI